VEFAGLRITKYGIALLAMILLGLVLRVYHLAAQSFWWDEAFSATVATQALPRIVSQSSAYDVHPPLYYILLHYWVVVFGTSDFAIRSLSVIFGVSAIPMIYVLGRRLFDEEVGIVSALILAILSYNIVYSQEARMYSLMALLALLSMYFFVRFLEKSTVLISFGYVLATTLLVYSHVLGVLMLIAQNVYLVTVLLLSKKRTFRLLNWIILEAIVIALFSPWIPIVVSSAHRAVKPLLQVNTFTQTFTAYSGRSELLWLFVMLTALSFFTFAKIRGPANWKEPAKALESYSWEVRIANLKNLYLLAVWLLTFNIIPYVVSHLSNYHIYLSKYVIAAAAALYVIVAKGIQNINYNYAKLAVVGVILVLSAANLQAYYGTPTKADARDVMSYVDGNAKSGDLVLVYTASSDAMIFNWYNNRTDLTAKNFPTNLADLSSKSAEENIKELRSDVAGHDRVWIVSTIQHQYPLDLVKALYVKTLNASYETTDSRSYFGYDVHLYEKRA
jgi:mannosyltransferase